MTPIHHNLGPEKSEDIIVDLRYFNYRWQVIQNYTDKDNPHGDTSSYLHMFTFRSLERKDKEAEWKMSIEIGFHLLDDVFTEARRRIDDCFRHAIDYIRHTREVLVWNKQ